MGGTEWKEEMTGVEGVKKKKGEKEKRKEEIEGMQRVGRMKGILRFLSSSASFPSLPSSLPFPSLPFPSLPFLSLPFPSLPSSPFLRFPRFLPSFLRFLPSFLPSLPSFLPPSSLQEGMEERDVQGSAELQEKCRRRTLPPFDSPPLHEGSEEGRKEGRKVDRKEDEGR
jgi:hypothetical protein